MGWNQVRWTEARQVASLMAIDEGALPAEGVVPVDHYRALHAAGEHDDALMFLGHALPRLEALAWAARVLEEAAGKVALRRADRQALDYALRWLGEPSEAARRAAMEAADLAGEGSAERMLAMGVFFSGGSISEPDLPPIQPPPEAAGRFAAGAIAIAAARADDRDAFLAQALTLGEKVAADGTRALEAA